MIKTNFMKGMKTALALSLAGVMFVSTGLTSFACTGLYFGSSTTKDGTTIYGRSEDLEEDHDKVWEVWEAADHKEGDMYEDNYGFTCPYPAHTLKFTACRDTTDMGESNPNAIAYGEVGVNEKGVSISATVSTKYNEKIKAVDPLVETGICEISIATMVLQEATSAKHGVELLGNIITTYGAGECNILTIGDANEVWYMEIVSGHQWVARKMPANKVAVFPNMMMLDQIDTKSADILCSEKLISTAKEAGSYYSENKANENTIHVSKSYSQGYTSGNTYRAWDGLNYLNPTLATSVDPTPVEDFTAFAPNADSAYREVALTHAKGPFTLCFDTNRQLDIKDAMKLLSLRGAGTKYEAEEVANRAIGWHTQMECHFFEVNHKLPTELATVQWLGMGSGECTVYVPSYCALLTDTPATYKYDSNKFSAKSMYWVYEEITKLYNANREKVAPTVNAYLEKVQDEIIKEQNDLQTNILALNKEGKTEEVAKAAQAGNASMTAKALEAGQYVLASLKEYVAKGCNGDFTLDGTRPTLTVKKPVLKLTAMKKGFKASWTKTADATKYQLMYSTNKNMKNAKKVSVTDTKKTFKSLKKNKRYYVKVRVCQNDYQGNAVWSNWSTVKSVKTK